MNVSLQKGDSVDMSGNEGTKRPRVSILMPSLNVAAYIRECLESVVGQTLGDIEIICIDAGSTDGTAETIREFAARDGRIRLLTSDRKSYGYQMNLGLAAAKGEYVGIIETDDIASANMFERMLEVAKKNEADVLKTDYYKFTGSVGEGAQSVVKCCGNPQLYGRVVSPVENPEVVTFSLNQSSLFRRSFLEEHGIRFNETPGASYQDIGFYLQTHLLAKRIFCLPEAFYRYRIDNPNSSINNSGKAYMVCGEVEFARKAIVAKCPRWTEIRSVFGREMYFSYLSTLRRIAPELRAEFALRFSEDLRAAYLGREIESNRFGAKNWEAVLGMMLMPLVQVDVMFPPEPMEKELPLVVSLTTWPKRIGLVYKVIDNMLGQTRRPDKVVLYLAEDEFSDHVLPDNLIIRLERDERFEVRYIENLKSHKKYIEVFRDFPDANVVLVDDDIVYPDIMLDELLKQHRRTPHAVIAMRSHVISMTKDGDFAEYREWMAERKIKDVPSALILATTGGGTLIPSGALPDSAFDRGKIRSAAFLADDLWIKWHLLMAGVPVVWIDRYGASKLQMLPGTQSETLQDANVSGGNNDCVWAGLQRLYPEKAVLIRKLLMEESVRLHPDRFLSYRSRAMRKWRGLKLCLAENGIVYTVFHAASKAAGWVSLGFHRLSGRDESAWRRSNGVVVFSWRSSRPAPIKSELSRIKVSVIIPVYGAEDYLAECLDSILCQTIGSFEILCVDDGSRDRSLDILRDYAAKDSRVTVIAQKNAGASVARNKALSLARGEFVAFMDPDDYYPDPASFQRMYEAAVLNRVRVACGYFERFNPETPDDIQRPQNYHYAPGVHDYAERPMDFGYQMYIFSRALLQENRLTFPNVSRYQDPPFFVRAMQAAGQFVSVDVPAYRYRLGHQKINWSKDDYRKARDMFRSMADVVSFAAEKGLDQIVSMTRTRINVDYKDSLFAAYPEVRQLPEFKLLMERLEASGAKDGR